MANVDASGAAGAIRENYTASYHTFASVKNSLLANNQAPASALRNFAGNTTGALTLSYSSLGGNVTDETVTSAQFMSGSDRLGRANLAASVAPALALNGGSTKSHALLRGSAAQRAGLASSVSLDQRDAPRHALPDAGAFELIEPEMSVVTAVDFGATPFDAPVARTITITNTQTSPLRSGPLMLADLALPAGYGSADFPSASLDNGQSASFSVTLSASASGLYQAPLSFTANDRYEPAVALNTSGNPNRHVIALTGLVTDTVDHWRQQYFGPGATNTGDAADTANPSGDGLANLLKYSLGLNPLVAYPPGTGVATSLDPAGHLRMTVAKNPAATDLALAIEVASDLAGWNAAETTIEQNTLTLLQAHDNASTAEAARRFIRLQVSRP